ncbi:class I SAM-dependent methyltransferase [Mycobacterium sp. SMC-8]|uniref:class I SAM-dependent methyltransferase n=1 Tax=Mycobacterium sp. SMC-8 TaxID=2857060 RepID=UPI0021B34581|nr:class I SAM-dependent methyltransferase [Mycobacterium sp. SMC-8]UXA13481.1 class I SAM-dependent methyltransferase [Mycobacterium sp. SMC-8]
MSEAMEAEFDTVAEWTAELARDLGPEYHIPAGCRGSGNPAALDWLVDRLQLRPGEVLLDCGAGVGGPAAYAADRTPVSPVLVEPQAGACRAARTLFPYPVVQATAGALPFPDNAFDAAWCLGVLCTTSDQLGVLTELRRVVRPPGRIGLLVFVAQQDLDADQQPDGNNFPTRDSLPKLLSAAGLRVDAELCTADLPAIPHAWEQCVDTVDEELRRRHARTRTWQLSEQQSDQMGTLLGDGLVVGVVMSVRHA